MHCACNLQTTSGCNGSISHLQRSLNDERGKRAASLRIVEPLRSFAPWPGVAGAEGPEEPARAANPAAREKRDPGNAESVTGGAVCGSKSPGRRHGRAAVKKGKRLKEKSSGLTSGPISTRRIYGNWPLPLSHAASPQLAMEPAGLRTGVWARAGGVCQVLKITSSGGRDWRRAFGTSHPHLRWRRKQTAVKER